MESHNMVLFLLNNEIISKESFDTDKFSLEKKGESNLIFYVNRLKNQDDGFGNKSAEFYKQKITDALIVKIKQNVNNLSDNLLVREALFFDIFKDANLFQNFPKAHEKARLGLFQSNSIVVRQFIENYRDVYRIFLNRKQTKNDQYTYLLELIKAIAKALYTFHHSIIPQDIREQFTTFLNPQGLRINPLFLQEIPPLNQYKLAPVYIKSFWTWVYNNQETIHKLIQNANHERQNDRLIHGDFRMPNILFSLTDKEIIKNKNIEAYIIDLSTPLFIDFEYWHLGDPIWDIVCLFQDLKTLGLNNISKYKQAFLEAYFGNTISNEVKEKIDATEQLLMLQNTYAELNETNYVNKIQEISKIIKP